MGSSSKASRLLARADPDSGGLLDLPAELLRGLARCRRRLRFSGHPNEKTVRDGLRRRRTTMEARLQVVDRVSHGTVHGGAKPSRRLDLRLRLRERPVAVGPLLDQAVDLVIQPADDEPRIVRLPRAIAVRDTTCVLAMLSVVG